MRRASWWFLASMLVLVRGAAAEVEREIAGFPAPDTQRDTGIGEKEAPLTRAATSDDPAVLIPLDETGVADWRFVNPRNPQKVPRGRLIEFSNRTVDRTFEVTTTLALRPGEMVPGRLPATVPLLIYDALTSGADRPAQSASETIEAYERRLIQRAKNLAPTPKPADWDSILDGLMELENALRDLARVSEEEAKKRAALLEMSLQTDGATIASARDELTCLREEKAHAAARVTRLTGPAESLGKQRATLTDFLVAQRAQKQKQRQRDNTSHEWRTELARQVALLDAAVEALKTQSPDSALTARLRMAVPSLRLDDCTIAATVTCTAALQVYPNGFAHFPYEVLQYQAEPTGPARFAIRFFEEEEVPARPVAFLVAEEQALTAGPPRSIATIAAIAGIGGAVEPFLEDRSATSRNCPFICPDKPYSGDDRAHSTGSGRVDIAQTYGNLLDGKVSFSFKEGDLGAGSSSLDVKLSQYRFNIYSQPGWTFHYGKFTYAAPSFGIAINESGEGGRIAFHNYAVSRLVKRESATGLADADNRDHEVWIAEATNMAIDDLWLQPILRTASVIYLRGNDRKGPQSTKNANTSLEETAFTGHDYETYGGQLNFAIPKHLYGSYSIYRSRRAADEPAAPCGSALHVCDGEGEVTLLTATLPFSIDEDGKARRTFTLTLGQGSGDDPNTTDLDEGYIGETAAYAPDQIFLSTLTGSISRRDFVDLTLFADPNDPARDRELKEEFHRLDLGVLGIGRGLANKRYVGMKYVDNDFSPLAWIATHILRIPEADIRSRATIITLNGYRLREELFGSTDAGSELDVEFQVETPRSVKATLKGGYYRPGSAVEHLIPRDVWSVSTGISIAL